MADEIGELLRPMSGARSVGEVAHHLYAGLCRLESEHPLHGRAVEVLVAGYSAGGTEPEVWRFVVPLDSGEPQSENLADQPINISPIGTASSMAVYELFDDYNRLLACDALPLNPGTTYNLAGLPMDEVRARAIARLGACIEEAPEQFNHDGVGGRWLIVELRPDRQSDPETVDLGPYGGDSRTAQREAY